jgi:hypothetical protein
MSTNIYKLVNGERIELTEAENNQRLADDAAAQAEQDARAWLDGRLSEYGSWPDQLDEMYHDFDGWKERIEAVKTKYPKP